jgi:hypothetical protein
VNSLAKRNARFKENGSTILESHKCLCVLGKMGIGKTELVIEFGSRVHADYCVRDCFILRAIKSDQSSIRSNTRRKSKCELKNKGFSRKRCYLSKKIKK